MFRKQLWQATAPGLAILWRRFPLQLQAAIMRCIAPSFLVGVSAVCLNERRQVLLLDHRFSKPHERWGLPGGLLERGESPMDGARREVREETGLSVEEVVPLQVSTHGPYLNIVFVCYVTQATIQLQTTELTGWQWCDPATVDLPMREHHLRAVRLTAEQVHSLR
jgi:ADP-ribose pyrophosphatase YjhB (NUDIX family)